MSGMIRSTPSWSGSGNMTPASMRIVVSSQDSGHHVHAELAEAAERHDLERGRRHVRYGGLIHRRAAASRYGRRIIAIPDPGQVVLVNAATSALAGRRSRNSGRWERLKTGAGSTTSERNYSIARAEPGELVEGQRLGPVFGRQLPPVQAVPARIWPIASATGLQGVRQRLPALQEEPRTSRLEHVRSPTSTAGGRKRSRTTADVTFGGGRNAPGGSVSSRSASATSATWIASAP